MFKFIKNLFGFGSTEPQETVKEILTPPVAPYKVEPPKVETPAVAETKKPARPRRPYRGNKNAGGTVAKVNQPKPAATEGKAKGGNGAVKQPNANNPKPKRPPRPKHK